MKLIIKTNLGKKIFIDVESSYKIKDIKAQIEKEEGILASEQKLIFQNIILENDKTILDYPITNNETISLFNSSSTNILIFINLAKDKFIPLEVQPTDSIEKVKAEIEAKKGFDPSKQKLIFQNNILQNEKTLEDYSICTDSTLFLIYPSNDGLIVNILIMINPNDNNDIKKTFPLEVGFNDHVEDLKAKIEDHEKIPVDKQRLVFCGHLLNNEQKLIDCSISLFSPIRLIIRKT